MTQAYSDPSREDGPFALPDIETFEAQVTECPTCGGRYPVCDVNVCPDCKTSTRVTGDYRWFWWTCFPGCLPESDPSGPFDTEAEALADALEDADVPDND